MLKLTLKIIISASILLNSCIVVKYQGGDEDKDVAPPVALSPKPEIPISNELVRSEKGDMIAFLPESWLFVDVERETPSDIIVFAVNPDYSLGAAFIEIPNDEEINRAVQNEGMIGLARMSFARAQERAGGKTAMLGKYQVINIGERMFAEYETTSYDSPYPAKNAAFISELGNYYQISLIPMRIKNKPMPSDKEIERIFRSILTTVEY